jgi:hypothetical protein
VNRLFLCTNIGSIPIIAYAMEDGFGAMVDNSNYLLKMDKISIMG